MPLKLPLNWSKLTPAQRNERARAIPRSGTMPLSGFISNGRMTVVDVRGTAGGRGTGALSFGEFVDEWLIGGFAYEVLSTQGNLATIIELQPEEVLS